MFRRGLGDQRDQAGVHTDDALAVVVPAEAFFAVQVIGHVGDLLNFFFSGKVQKFQGADGREAVALADGHVGLLEGGDGGFDVLRFDIGAFAGKGQDLGEGVDRVFIEGDGSACVVAAFDLFNRVVNAAAGCHRGRFFLSTYVGRENCS